ncbi:CDP-glucose 4,6-dehydratase [Fodinisporobacter ferrooxydans]|uniref:CDP-glucose 4,6-dehydratase n=1 Tax=Fodinisporobacter ferrooxydans TaxID=2901836 RepID=A0ABY4CR17_9BACL|nr:CDP-glucose 4,6-dehydratase [Alicyclobacillaceae bacterium MYW30-H2]
MVNTTMENRMDKNFWENKRVFITGHTGFKGSWLALTLHLMGAEIVGYALEPSTTPSLFQLCRINTLIKSIYGDIRNKEKVEFEINSFKPEIIFHLSAQPLVRKSYLDPYETFSTNVMGTVNILEAIRKCNSVKAVVNVTTDKVYENKEWVWGYREIDNLGGYDPYSSSKACSELVTAAYRSSFYNSESNNKHVGIATARAGNVIGGGDWSSDRLIPDCIRSILEGKEIVIRSPESSRPWQHVLEPIKGYLILAQKLYENGEKFSGAWNFGPDDNDVKTVKWMVEELYKQWGGAATYKIEKKDHLHESKILKLDNSKAKSGLNWYPKWNIDYSVEKVVEWVHAYKEQNDLKEISINQIIEYFNF